MTRLPIVEPKTQDIVPSSEGTILHEDASLFPGSLTISNERILLGLRDVSATLGATITDPRQRELVALIDMAIDELANRHESAFYVASYKGGYALLHQGLELLGERAQTLKAHANELSSTLESDLSFAEMTARLSSLGGLLYLLVEALGNDGSEQGRALLAGIVDWELDLIRPREPKVLQKRADTKPATSKLAAADLERYLRDRFPDRAELKVASVRVIPGGFSKTTTLFEINDPQSGSQSLVMRAEQPITQYHMDGSNIANEFPTVRFAYESGLPVAEPLWFEGDSSKLGTRFFVSRKADGQNVGDILAGRADVSRSTIDEMMRILAQIHRTPLDPLNPLLQASHLGKWARHATMAETARASVLYWQDIARKCGSDTSPLIARGFNWLLDNLPDTKIPPVLVHGDYGMHNIMIDNGDVTAVLDWEASHVGDPADEFILLFRAMERYISPKDLFDIYLSHGGQPIDTYRMRFFEVLSCLKAPAFGYGSLKVLEENPGADLKLSYIHYYYNYPLASMLNRAIEAAEAAKK